MKIRTMIGFLTVFLLVQFSVVFNGTAGTKSVTKAGTQLTNTSGGRGALLGEEKAKVVYRNLKIKYADLPVTVEKLATAVIGTNLTDALQKGAALKGLVPSETCNNAREMLTNFPRDVACEEMMDQIAQAASCDTVEGLLAYFSEHLLDDAQGACTYHRFGNGGIGICGCEGCACCMVLLSGS